MKNLLLFGVLILSTPVFADCSSGYVRCTKDENVRKFNFGQKFTILGGCSAIDEQLRNALNSCNDMLGKAQIFSSLF